MPSPALGSRTSPRGTAHPGATSNPPPQHKVCRRAALSPKSPPRHKELGDPGTPPCLPPPPLPLPACTVRRRRRKAVAAQPQRRAAGGRVPVSLAIVSHLPGRAVPDGRLCRPRAPPARTATSIGGNWDPPLPRERLPAPIHPTPTPSPTSQGVVLQRAPSIMWDHCRSPPSDGAGPVRSHSSLCCGDALGLLHSRHSACSLPAPPAHGYSWRRQPSPSHHHGIGLPAGTACPFPSLCSQDTACAARVPGACPRWPLAHPDGSCRALQWHGAPEMNEDGHGGGGGMVRIE